MAETNPPLSPENYEKLLRLTELPVIVGKGTDYPCTQGQIDAYQHFRGRDVPSIRGTREVIRYFNRFLYPAPVQTSSLKRLAMSINHPGKWGPDVAVKAFHDIDTAFFGGELRDRVCI